MENIHFYNTLSGTKDTFSPLSSHEVTMYSCGPTVYNYAHIGNLRSYVFADIVRRTLEFSGYSVKQVLNITDVGHLTSDQDTGEDKVEKMALKEGKTVEEITDFYTKAFLNDIESLNIEIAQEYPTQFPKATEYIEEQIDLIQKLEAKGLTYKISDGIYFDTSQYKDYGKLGGIHLEKLKEGARVEIKEEKKNPTDFALWKFSTDGEKRLQEWDSPWGVGFPGWHIECSAMSMKNLGETLDIHTGGIDHIPVHHNNEIAQSESITGKEFVRFWLHNDFVQVDSGKMAKSEGNFITLQTLKEHGIHPLSYRYWLLTSHYRSPVTFSFEAVKASQQAFERLLHDMWWYKQDGTDGTVIQEWIDNFTEKIYDDLSTPQALAYLYSVQGTDHPDKDKHKTLLLMDKIFGLKLKELSEEIGNIPEDIHVRVQERDVYKKQEDWQKADAIREEIEREGYVIEDNKTGSVVWKNLSSLI